MHLRQLRNDLNGISGFLGVVAGNFKVCFSTSQYGDSLEPRQMKAWNVKSFHKMHLQILSPFEQI